MVFDALVLWKLPNFRFCNPNYGSQEPTSLRKKLNNSPERFILGSQKGYLRENFPRHIFPCAITARLTSVHFASQCRSSLPSREGLATTSVCFLLATIPLVSTCAQRRRWKLDLIFPSGFLEVTILPARDHILIPRWKYSFQVLKN